MESKGITSRRGLAVLLAGGTTDKAQVERWRKSVRRMLSRDTPRPQRTIQQATAERLSAVLDVPASYWPTERGRPKDPVEMAEILFRRLDAGETIPADLLEATAVPLEETARIYAALADRLRASAATGDSTP